jgi:uracil-DNA glycosylase
MSDAESAADSLRSVALQYLQVDRMMGVDFLPLTTGRNSPAQQPQVPAAPSLSPEEKQRLLNELRSRHDSACGHCTSVTTHTQTVFGEGNPAADLMFIGEAPGEEEDRTGRPFVGRAGQKLEEIIAAMGFSREGVYIANVLKSRPPENRTPLPHEVEVCAPFLAEQIRIIRPRVIIALGGPAAKWLLKTDIGITRLRGQWGQYEDGDLRIPVMPTFHPAYLLRNYTTDTRQKVWSDMQQANQRLRGA